MTDESALAPEAGPEAIVEQPAGEQTEGQTDGLAAEGEQPEEERKSKAAERREREKEQKRRIVEARDAALAEARQAKAESARLLEEIKSLKRPTETDFPDPFDLTAENAGLSAERRILEREAKKAGEVAEAALRQAEEMNQRERAVLAEAWTAQVAEAKTRYADFEAVAHAKDLPVTQAMGDIIMTGDNGPDVLYFLGQNRVLAAQIAQLNPVEAARAIGRIEAKLTLPKPRTETNAPAPISPVRGSAGASRAPDKMTYKEFVKYRESGGTIS